jgi:(R,R)-butanediol dehydrogenase/meso-butanediol dehydrogenase/diacetyl reductase
MQHSSLILHAIHDPVSLDAGVGAHLNYRDPRVSIESKSPAALAAGDLRIEMLYAGVCGTDLHLVQSDPKTGYIRCSSPTSVPMRGRVLGHEGIGRVVEIGSGLIGSHWQPGAIVAIESIIACGTCDRCRRHQPNQCRRASLLGSERDGLFASYADLPASILHDVSAIARQNADLQALACLEPAAVAWVACENARLAQGERVTVFGAGPIGVYCAMLAREVFNAAVVEVVEPLPFRRDLVGSWADRVVSPEEYWSSSGSEIDVVFEASGGTRHIDAIVPRLDAGGRVVMLGRSGEPLVVSHTDHLITNAISITGSRGNLGGAFPALIALYRDHGLALGKPITRVVDGLDALAEVLRAPDTLAATDCKILVRFPTSRTHD